MKQFKLGDRVRILKKNRYVYGICDRPIDFNEAYTIIEVHPRSNNIVKLPTSNSIFDDGWWFDTSDLMLIPVTTKIGGEIL